MNINNLKNQTLALLFALTCFFGQAQNKEITILAVNDMHAAIDRFPQFVALVDSMRTAHPNLLLFAAGDNRTGNPANDMHPVSSFPMMTLMNKAGFNLSAVGNHEFDGNIDGLRSVVHGSNFRYVCANMYAPDSMRLFIEPYKIFEIDGVKIGVLGLIQQGANGLPDSHPNNLKNIAFRPFDQVAEEYNWLRNHCDVFVLLVHEGYDESIELLNQNPVPDVMISGHSHTPVQTTELHNGVLLTQAGSGLKYVTHITLQLQDGKITKKESNLMDVNAFSKFDTAVQRMVNEFNSNESLLRELTMVNADFSDYEELGSMMTDAIRIETGADLALQNPGGVRFNTFPKGMITVRDIYRLDPFNNNVIEYNLTGEEVLRLIKAAYIAEGKEASYISGATYEMEIDKQGEIKKLQVKMNNGVNLDPKQKYKVVMNSYLSAVSLYEKDDPGKDLFITSANMTIGYLEKQPSIDYKGVKRVTVKMK